MADLSDKAILYHQLDDHIKTCDKCNKSRVSVDCNAGKRIKAEYHLAEAGFSYADRKKLLKDGH